MPLAHDRAFEPRYGEAVALSPLIARLTARNPGPFTFHGTNTYLIGNNTLAVIDPGPESETHVDAIIAAAGGRPISHIVVTHTHRDHSPAARMLAARTAAPIIGAGPHQSARARAPGEVGALDSSNDMDHAPDRILNDADSVAGDGWTLEAVATPGHTANHLAFSLKEENALFSGDHVMAWSTTIVAPPDGSMAQYMASLDRLMERSERIYFPGHGGAVADPSTYLPALKAHRLARERAVVERVRAGDETIPAMVKSIYRDTDPALHAAAALSVLAHVEDLLARGLLAADGPASLSARYRAR